MSSDYSGSAATSTYRVQFVPRTYPMLGLTATMLYVLSGLVVLSAIGLIVFFVTSGVPGVLAFVGSLLAHFLAVVSCIASAESIRLLIDIQENTQSTAYYAKLSNLAK